MADTRKGQTSRKMTHASLKVKVDLEHLFYENREGGGVHNKGPLEGADCFPLSNCSRTEKKSLLAIYRKSLENNVGTKK